MLRFLHNVCRVGMAFVLVRGILGASMYERGMISGWTGFDMILSCGIWLIVLGVVTEELEEEIGRKNECACHHINDRRKRTLLLKDV